MSVVHVNIDKSWLDAVDSWGPPSDLKCFKCMELRGPTYVEFSDLHEGASKGCKTCSIIFRGLTKFEKERERAKQPESAVEIDIRPGLPIRLTTERIFHSVDDAEDPPVYEIYTLPDQSTPYLGITSSPDVSLGPVAYRWLDVAAKWIRECFNNHPRCKRFGATPMPHRILDVSGPPRLLETRGVKGVYICLSYCWGASLNLCSTSKNIDQMMQGTKWSSMPKTLRDAVIITRLLRVKYLWIDSLCILQDDDADWERESMAMASIYENAFLTVAASGSADTHQGCFLEPCSRAQEIYQVNDDSLNSDPAKLYMRRSFNHTPFGNFLHKNFSSVPLLGRGWALQEHLMSPRVLQFTDTEILWECDSSIACECGGVIMQGEQTKQTHSLALKNGDRRDLAARWGAIIQRYTCLKLTKDSDRLPALSGIAKQFLRRGLLGSYYAGLWEHDFIHGLAWFSPDKSVARKPQMYRAPSWSWASVEGAMHPSLHFDNAYSQARVEKIVVETFGTDSTGRCQCGYCILSSDCVEASLILDKTDGSKDDQQRYGIEIVPGSHNITFTPDVHLDANDMASCSMENNKILLFYIGTEPNVNKLFCFLVLQPKTSSFEHNAYCRIGLIKASSDELKEFPPNSITKTVVVH